jgi:Ca-activated chloride channel family protein
MKHIEWTIAVLICTTGIIPLHSQNPIIESNPVAPQELIVDVDLTNITATVIDESGKYVEGLTAEDFRVVEDGQEQKISFFSHESQAPISLGVLIDTSGSVQDKLHQGLQTMRTIAATLSSADEMFVITFDSHITFKQGFTNDPEQIQRSLRDIHAHGETAVYDAIARGLSEMQTAKHQKRILLLLSDGFDTKSRITVDQAEDLLKHSNVVLYAIGVDDDAETAARRHPRYRIYDYMLNKLSSAGGGRLVRLYTGKSYDLRSLSDLFLGELRQQYTIGYYSRAGTRRDGLIDIEVRVTKPGVQVVCCHENRHAGPKYRSERKAVAE